MGLKNDQVTGEDGEVKGIMGDFSLIKIDGKPVEKLLDVISKAVGKIYEPRAIRKEADAKAYEIEVIESAKARAYLNKQEIEQDILDRIQERTLFREVKKQEHIDAVTRIAIEQLQNEKEVSDTPVNEDWTVRFFNIVEDVSDEQMQQLWGKILAGEVKTPNSYSIHTLELLKNLSKPEAELFEKAASYVIFFETEPFICNAKDGEIFKRNNLSFDDCLLLIELGLIMANADIGFIYEPTTNDVEYVYNAGKYMIKATRKANSLRWELPVLSLTRVGKELLKLLNPVPIDNYIKGFYFYLENIGLVVEYALINKDNEEFEHTQSWMKFES
jgi:hypothetical protein